MQSGIPGAELRGVYISSESNLISGLFGRPLVPAVVAFACGIIGYYVPAVLASAALFGAAAMARPGSRAMALALAGFAALGWGRQALSGRPAPNDASRFIGRGFVTLRGSVHSDPERSARSVAFLFHAESVEGPDGVAVPSDGIVSMRIPAEAGLLEYGDGLEIEGTLRNPGGSENPGLFRFPDYLARLGVYSAMNVRRAQAVRRIQRGVGMGDRIARWMQRRRDSLMQALQSLMRPLEANLMAGIALGQRTRLPADLTDDFAVTGTTHILASSGMNVGMAAGGIFWLGRKCRIRRSRVVFLVIPAILLYTLLAGAKPSIVRADVMATAILLAFTLDREPDVPSAMALAALILLFLQPAFLFDPGFQLSFAVVAALVGVMPLVEPLIRSAAGAVGKRAPLRLRVLHGLAAGFVMSMVAQVAALPLTAQHFNQVSLLGIAANALILPVIPVLFAGGFALWALAWNPLASAAAWPLGLVLAYVIGVARAFGDVPWASVSVASPGWLFVGIYYLLLGFAVHLLRVNTEPAE